MNNSYVRLLVKSKCKVVPLIAELKSLGYKIISIERDYDGYLVQIDRYIEIKDLLYLKRRFSKW